MNPYNLALYRSWFPFIEEKKIWLNHAAISPLSTRVRAAIDRFLEEQTTGDIDIFLPSLEAHKQLKHNIAQLIHTTPDRIGLVGNTSEGINILTNGLEWKSGDRIILNDIEFPTNVVPFLNLKQHGVEIDFVKNERGEVSIESIERAITPNTKLLSISFVQFLSGYRADLKAIGELCKARKIIFCVDGIQGVGVSPIDVQEMNIDFLSNGGNKWLMGMLGLGFIFLTEELQKRIQQQHIGWTSNKNFFGDFFNYRIDLDETARRYENGTQNFCGVVALRASTEALLEVGIQNIESHVRTLTERLLAHLSELGCEIISPHDAAKRAGIVSFAHSRTQEIFQALTKEHIGVSQREGMIRVAPHFYNSLDEIETVCSLVKKFS